MLFAVQSLRSPRKTILIWRQKYAPVCDVFLMHELETLIQSLSKMISEDNIEGIHLTNLREECHKFAKSLETRIVEGAQKWHNHQLLASVGYLNNVEQGHTVVTKISSDLRG